MFKRRPDPPKLARSEGGICNSKPQWANAALQQAGGITTYKDITPGYPNQNVSLPVFAFPCPVKMWEQVFVLVFSLFRNLLILLDCTLPDLSLTSLLYSDRISALSIMKFLASLAPQSHSVINLLLLKFYFWKLVKDVEYVMGWFSFSANISNCKLKGHACEPCLI